MRATQLTCSKRVHRQLTSLTSYQGHRHSHRHKISAMWTMKILFFLPVVGCLRARVQVYRDTGSVSQGQRRLVQP